MARPLQKRKSRSSRPKIRPRVPGRTKAGKKKVNFLGNEHIAKAWDRGQTLEKNYARLGLSTKLNEHVNKAALRRIKGKNSVAKVDEVEVERDPDTGRILRVVTPGGKKRNNPLNDPLNELDSDSDEGMEDLNVDNTQGFKDDGNIIAALEAQAEQEALIEAKRKRPRQQSGREEEWIKALVNKYGDDTGAMSRDKKLNVMQQSEGDIKRRVKKWRERNG